MSKRKLILDCDPGQDDALAILLALASPELDVLAITAVAGNIGLEKTSLNARAVVELAGASTPHKETYTALGGLVRVKEKS